MQTFASAKKELLTQAKASKIFGLIANEMSLVEAEYERQVQSNIQVVNYLGDYLRASGGKRVRPALLILASGACGGATAGKNVISLATVMEMLHTATLVHDDIIDNADLRRNRASVNARFGNQTAVLMGDWLYMSAFETSLQERSLEILDILTRLTRKMTEGELIQLTMIGRLDISESDYFDILKRKTAFLFSACAEIGAILAGSTLEQQHALRDYGMNLGIAFQLADDILDLTSEAENLGKAAGTDLLEGKVTLPLIYLLQSEPSLRPKLEDVMLTGAYNEISRDDIRELLDVRGIIGQIRERAKEFADAARKNLDVFTETEYRVALEGIPNFVIDRNS
ncbi:MAG TPA: polyprenyl synthetase family protein [Pyrinomonadaceae bacterium]|nr:polyprenyl synthetase family protein [Chloracidobacterium sp.]MBP9936872.1 polyprenyl synthetase family protein [Pyrinomonadaceae bacterium]MBK7804033.1 polyprenyl synthetase family protein [Chloracidobacterium sp.]MBK9439298.1 polyprenyl synthetase family protein [Chloracidobacterium sp.]MBK9768731.1 polyprenyl synthetase family protein [Chloracidobacterium sp.]